MTYHIKIRKSSTDTSNHVLSLGIRWWAGVQRSVEPSAHLLNTRLQLFTLEERNEHRFVDLVAL